MPFPYRNSSTPLIFCFMGNIFWFNHKILSKIYMFSSSFRWLWYPQGHDACPEHLLYSQRPAQLGEPWCISAWTLAWWEWKICLWVCGVTFKLFVFRDWDSSFKSANLLLYILGSSKESADTETNSDDDSFAGYKKKGHKITFSDDDEDFSLPPKPSTSKGLKGSNDSKSTKCKT